ncbi:MAG TPA: hypothetical protein VIH66_05890 [Gammaproteobacteria bacterium]
MKYFIKIWPDNTATLVTDHGETVTAFDSLEEAQHALRSLTNRQALYEIKLAPYIQKETARSAA